MSSSRQDSFSVLPVYDNRKSPPSDVQSLSSTDTDLATIFSGTRTDEPNEYSHESSPFFTSITPTSLNNDLNDYSRLFCNDEAMGPLMASLKFKSARCTPSYCTGVADSESYSDFACSTLSDFPTYEYDIQPASCEGRSPMSERADLSCPRSAHINGETFEPDELVKDQKPVGKPGSSSLSPVTASFESYHGPDLDVADLCEGQKSTDPLPAPPHSQLKRRKRKGSGIVEYAGPACHSCSMCDSCFRRPEHLRRHQDSLHSDNKHYHCPIACFLGSRYCSTSSKQGGYNRSDNLMDHLSTHIEDKRKKPRNFGFAKEAFLRIMSMPMQQWSPVRTRSRPRGDLVARIEQRYVGDDLRLPNIHIPHRKMRQIFPERCRGLSTRAAVAEDHDEDSCWRRFRAPYQLHGKHHTLCGRVEGQQSRFPRSRL